ncbi:hypothetical protein EV424DRAFT_1575808 [Suillus variegatus]|nr:hypothetical protein EV424DRAFT_1575808 [Suillus variegatus]
MSMPMIVLIRELSCLGKTQGAGMGLISFLFCIARIVVAILLVILTPTISIGAGSWVAYGILGLIDVVSHGEVVANEDTTKPWKKDKGSSSSHHSGGPPPSVLRHEHALQPYREDSDDDAESGYIMSAWQPFPGFSRIGGSHAHYDSPYTIVSGTGGSSTFMFPSMECKHSGPVSIGTPMKMIYDDEELPTPTASIANVTCLPVLMGSGLPTGAMLPHMHTKSQTAVIIGDVDALNATPVNAPMQEEHPLMATKMNGGESNNSDPDQPKKRFTSE